MELTCSALHIDEVLEFQMTTTASSDIAAVIRNKPVIV